MLPQWRVRQDFLGGGFCSRVVRSPQLLGHLMVRWRLPRLLLSATPLVRSKTGVHSRRRHLCVNLVITCWSFSSHGSTNLLLCSRCNLNGRLEYKILSRSASAIV